MSSRLFLIDKLIIHLVIKMEIIILKELQNKHKADILAVLDNALKISGYKGKVIIQYMNNKEKDTYAITSWPLKYFFRIPVISLNKLIFGPDNNILGYTLTHELIHCRQGCWTIFYQNIKYLFKKGFPPFEIEAYDSINQWYDAKCKNKK